MAQKTEKEETEFKVPAETLPLCVNNCGFTGNPATNNMCQKCFNSASSPASSGSILPSSSSHKEPTSRSASSRSPRRLSTPPPHQIQGQEDRNMPDRSAVGESQSLEPSPPAKREVNRCSGCRRKVGLTGFRCRCGELFCSEHRYSDRHDCSYDYKAAGREAIARENPMVKAAKLVKI